MRFSWLLCFLTLEPACSRASEFRPDPPRSAVFGGSASSLPLVLPMLTATQPVLPVIAQRLQLATHTAAALEPVSLGPLIPHTRSLLVESSPIPFPAVHAPTRFLVRWLAHSGQLLGSTRVDVFPTNLIAELGPLADGLPIGLLDSQRQLRPLLDALRVPSVNLAAADLESFQGRLAILGPFSREHPAPPDLAQTLHRRSQQPLAAVWLCPTLDSTSLDAPLLPSFHTIQLGQVTVVVAQGDLVRDLSTDPRSQQTLIQLARHAVHPRHCGLPDYTTHHTP